MEQVAMLAAIAFTVNKTASVVKAIITKQVNTVVTQFAVWIIGIATVVLTSHADVTAALVVPGITQTLGQLDGASQVLLGWVLGSTGSFAFDFKKAFDNSDNAVEPPLITPPAVPPPA